MKSSQEGWWLIKLKDVPLLSKNTRKKQVIIEMYFTPDGSGTINFDFKPRISNSNKFVLHMGSGVGCISWDSFNDCT